MQIRTREQLERWLDENSWLEDVQVEALEPAPSPTPLAAPLSEGVRIVIRRQVSGGYRAGDVVRVRRLRLAASGVSEYSIADPSGFALGHCCEGAFLLDADAELGIGLDLPAELRLACAAIEVGQEEWDETVEPRFSDREFSAVVPGRPLPTPAEWLAWCRSRGLDAVWRYYASDEVPPGRVPQADYSGWFLQIRSRLSADPQGLFFFGCGTDENGYRVHVRCYDDEYAALWDAAAAYVAESPQATVHNGNAVLSGVEWKVRLSRRT